MNQDQKNHCVARAHVERLSQAFTLAAALALGACGGGGGGSSVQSESVELSGEAPNQLAINATEVDPGTQALMQEGARLNTAELEEIAKIGVLPKPFDGPVLSGEETDAEPVTKSLGERKSAASRTAVYRFFNSRTGAHFFTTSTTERDNVRDTLSYMAYEGPAFYASGTEVPGLSPAHRFYNTQTGVHFYTISESERAHVAATLPQFNYEGIAYYASTLPGTGYTPLYRFFYSARGFHFYTNSEAEKDNIIATLPQYSYEGVGYYVLGSDWRTPAIPHSGVTNSQCYQTGSNGLVDCASAGALALNPQQDGHRTAINPMSYSLVISGYLNAFPVALPLYHPKTDCLRDNVTGLIWEGKTASGGRAGSNTYTNHGDNRAGDTAAYVATVNSLGLCGFNDWRLATTEELQSILHYGVVGSGPKISVDWFPNTGVDAYWSATADATSSSFGWAVQFAQEAGTARTFGAEPHRVRLVRGLAWVGPRYLLTTKPYPSDGANNAVIDRKTGLVWRRCMEGSGWSGTACTYNTEFHFGQEDALAHASSLTGWRVPNTKELSSLPDHSRRSPALDPGMFPAAIGSDLWSTTPYAAVSFYAMRTNFGGGSTSQVPRENISLVRLVFDGY